MSSIYMSTRFIFHMQIIVSKQYMFANNAKQTLKEIFQIRQEHTVGVPVFETVSRIIYNREK